MGKVRQKCGWSEMWAALEVGDRANRGCSAVWRRWRWEIERMEGSAVWRRWRWEIRRMGDAALVL